MIASPLVQAQQIIDQLGPPDQVRLLEYLVQRVAKALEVEPTKISEGSATEESRSWETLFQLIDENSSETGIVDLAHQHDHYLYNTDKR